MSRTSALVPALKLLLVLCCWAHPTAQLQLRPTRRAFLVSGSAASASSVLVGGPGPAAGRPAGQAPPGFKLTRSELTKKLEGVPVFFVREGDGSVALDEDEGAGGSFGTFFVEVEDAEKLVQTLRGRRPGGEVEVASAQLASIYLPLVLKQAKPSVFEPSSVVAAALAASEDVQPYEFTGTASEIERANLSPPVRRGAVPVFFIPALTFVDPQGPVRRPLFFREQDALNTFALRARSRPAGSDATPELVVAELNRELVPRLLQGQPPFPGYGVDPRSLEFIPSGAAVEAAQLIAAQQYLRAGR